MIRVTPRPNTSTPRVLIFAPRTLIAAVLGLILCGCGDSGATSAGGSGGVGGLGGLGGRAGNGGGAALERRMFVTSTAQSGALGGIEGADALCAQQATEAGLEGEFRAWLSTTSSSVAERLMPEEDARYVLVDGTLLATSWEDLLDGSIAARINLDASGQTRSGDVWTGTLATGASYEVDDCEGFTSTMGTGLCGTTASSGSLWTENATPFCLSQLRLYCIEE